MCFWKYVDESNTNDKTDIDVIVTTHIMELGIIFHSIIIGVGLGVLDSTSSAQPLLIALCFHQFFEGMSLASYLQLSHPTKRLAIIMLGIFSITTSCGIIIGVLVKHTYDPESSTAHATQGVFNAIAAGILLHMALVDLIASEFHRLVNTPDCIFVRKAEMVVAIWIGAAAMALLGIWA